MDFSAKVHKIRPLHKHLHTILTNPPYNPNEI